MVKLGISIKSSTYLIRRLLKTMTSWQGCGVSSSLRHCRKSPFTRTVTSDSTDSGQGKVTVESRDCRSTEREGLQWDKLSEDEKNIYLAHKNACMVRPTIAIRKFFFLRMCNISISNLLTIGYFAMIAEILHAHWLIFIVNKQADTWIYNLCNNLL